MGLGESLPNLSDDLPSFSVVITNASNFVNSDPNPDPRTTNTDNGGKKKDSCYPGGRAGCSNTNNGVPDIVSNYADSWGTTQLAWDIVSNPNAGWGAWVPALAWLAFWGGAHAGLAIGGGALICVAVTPTCLAAISTILGIGEGVSADGDPTNEVDSLVTYAKSLYPKLANLSDQLHHPWPLYLGGDPAQEDYATFFL